MKRFRLRGLADMDSFSFVVGHGRRDSALGSHAHSDNLPTVDEAVFSELSLNGGHQVIGAYADEKMPLKTTIYAVIHGTQAQIAFEGPKTRFHKSEGHVVGTTAQLRQNPCDWFG